MARNKNGVYLRGVLVGGTVFLGCLSNAVAADATVDTSQPTNKPPSLALENETEGSSDELGRRTRKQFLHEITVSSDYLVGFGYLSYSVGIPQRFAHNANPGTVGDVVPRTFNPERDTRFLGTTFGYQWGNERQWYVDFSYAKGNSEAKDLNVGSGQVKAEADVAIDESRYQGYIAYTFPGLRGTDFSAYTRVGIRYVSADLEGETADRAYVQTTGITDIMGAVGAGVKYILLPTGDRRPISASLQLEGEGFFGRRHQDMVETTGPTSTYEASFNNDLYGGIGRATLDLQYYVGERQRVRFFAQGGIEAKYTKVKYTGIGLTDELLWGPYVKGGVRFLW